MTVGQWVEALGRVQSIRQELGPDVPMWEQMVHTQELNPGGITLLEPKVGPPLQGNQVAKPLKLKSWIKEVSTG